MSDLGGQLADILRRLERLESSPRAPHTSLRDGFLEVMPRQGPAMIRLGGDTDDENVTLTVVDTLGRDAIEIGTRSDGTAYIRALNPDGEMDAFSVTAGQGGFPPALAGWMRRLNDAALDLNGRPVANTGTFQMLWHTMVPVTAPYVYVPNVYLVEASTTAEFRLRFSPIAAPVSQNPTGSSGVQADVGPVSFGAGSASQAFTSLAEPGTSGTVVEIPMIWTPAASQIGSTLVVTMEARIASGPGVAYIYPTAPIMCVDL